MKLAVMVGGLDKPKETIEALLKNEVCAVETGYPFYMEAEAQKLGEVGKAFKDNGIALRTVHSAFSKEVNISSLDKALRNQTLETHKKLLGKVALAGVEMIIMHPGSTTDNPNEIPTMCALALESLSELVKTAQNEGVKIALENMLPKHPGSDVRQVIDIVNQVNSPWLGVCFDTGHAHVSGGMRQAFEILRSRIITFHVHDNDATRDMHLQPPYGTINWVDFVEVLPTMSFSDPITIEAAPWGKGNFKWMQKEILSLFQSIVNGSKLETIASCRKCGHIIFRDEGAWTCFCSEAK